jgi:glutathione S-transferase
MSQTPVRVEVSEFIRGRREDVFAAWVVSEIAAQWHCPEGMKVVSFTSSVKVGGEFHFVMKGESGTFTTWGEYKEVIQNRKLVFTWGPAEQEKLDSVVTVEFFDQDGGTLVTLIHEKLPQGLVPGHVEGWKSTLRNLKTHFESKKL